MGRCVPGTARFLPVLACVLVLCLAGCGGGGDASNASPMAATPAARTGPTPPEAPLFSPEASAFSPVVPGPRAARAAGPRSAQDSGYAVDTASRAQVRLFYRTVMASTDGIAPGWTGDVASCAPGETSADHQAAVLRRVNWFRAMAGLPANVQLDATFSAKARQAALYMSANHLLTHGPTAGSCFNATVAEAAAKSNLALGTSGAESVSRYIRDAGDNAAVGHRRWLLYPQARRIGTGDIPTGGAGSPPANALWVLDGNFGAPRPAVRDGFVAWPPPGYTPHTAVWSRWSFAYPDADFTNATVTMSQDGTLVPTCKETVANGFGENTLAWRAGCLSADAAWTPPSRDTSYLVTIANVGNAPQSTFSYTVTVFDPDQAGPGDAPITLTGSDVLAANELAAYTFAAVPGATSYAYRMLAASPATSSDGAGNGTANVIVSASAGYEPVATNVSAHGNASFHLAHTGHVDQLLRVRPTLLAGPAASLQFNSRLGLSAPTQHAVVEVSADDGASWVIVYDQPGQQTGNMSETGEEAFTAKTVDLAAFAHRTVQIRFRYLLQNGTYYPQASEGVGWYIDDIRPVGFDVVTDIGPVTVTGQPTVPFSAPNATRVMLQARAGMFGYFGEWGMVKAVTVAASDRRDCLFDWAQTRFPGLLAPHAASIAMPGFYLRHYPASHLYVGIATGDVPALGARKDHVYFYRDGVVRDLGDTAAWFAAAGC